MENNIVRVDHEFEEEIDLFKLLDIFIKNFKLFLIMTFIGSILTVVFVGKRIVFDKNNVIYINYTLNHDELESYLGGKVYYPQISPDNILLDDEYVEKLFEVPALKEIYEAKVTQDKELIETKRQFLNNSKIIQTVSLKSLAKETDQDSVSPYAYKTTVRLNKKLDANREASKTILNAYLQLSKEYYDKNVFGYISERKEYLEKMLPPLKRQLEENAVVSQGAVPASMGENNYFKYMYPIKVSNIDTYYEKYKTFENEYQSIKALSDAGINNYVRFDSSIIVEKEKSKNLMFLGIGIFISLAIGVLSTFLKEFVEEYRKSKNNEV